MIHARISGPAAVVAGVALASGINGVLVRQIDLPAQAVVMGRMAIAAACLAVWLEVRGRGSGTPWFPRHAPVRSLVAGVIFAVHLVSLFAAFERAPIGSVLLIVYLAPIGIALLAPSTLGEHHGTRTWRALGLGAAGSTLLFAPGLTGMSRLGGILAGVAAASYVALVLLWRPLAAAHGGVRVASAQTFLCALLVSPLAIGVDWRQSARSWAFLALLGLTGACFLGLYFWAMARTPATHVGVLAYLEPVGGTLFGWLLLSERPTVGTLLGGTLIVAAGMLVALARAEDGPRLDPATAARP